MRKLGFVQVNDLPKLEQSPSFLALSQLSLISHNKTLLGCLYNVVIIDENISCEVMEFKPQDTQIPYKNLSHNLYM